MKTINLEDQKKLMLDMLAFVDGICRENDIKYSLYAGSLIGAIRHKGYIPWDDDIDIILTKENYIKLKKILDVLTGRYQTLKYEKGGKCFSFIKLIDTYTQALEGKLYKFNPDYGVYIDIFCYYPASDDHAEQKKQYKKIELLVSLIARRRLDFGGQTIKKNLLRFGKNIVSMFLGYRNINRLFDKVLNQYDNTEYLICNWPAYGFEKEIQLKKNTEEYIDAEFEGLKVMIFKKYDEVLRSTFGDYMQLPPESERVPKHHMKMWWKEGYEEQIKK